MGCVKFTLVPNASSKILLMAGLECFFFLIWCLGFGRDERKFLALLFFFLGVNEEKEEIFNISSVSNSYKFHSPKF